MITTRVLLHVVPLVLGVGACTDPLHGSIRKGATVDTLRAEDAADVAPPDDSAEAEAIVAALDGLRWELPCLVYVAPNICTTAAVMRRDTTLSGDPDRLYAVTLRFRGVVEDKSYYGANLQSGRFQLGGQPNVDDWNTYALRISDPPSVAYLNRGTSGYFHVGPIDFTTTLSMRGGATLTLEALAYDDQQIPNLDVFGLPVLVPDVAPYPAAFDGQFIQMDVVSITSR